MFVIQKRYNYILYPYVELSIKFQKFGLVSSWLV